MSCYVLVRIALIKVYMRQDYVHKVFTYSEQSFIECIRSTYNSITSVVKGIVEKIIFKIHNRCTKLTAFFPLCILRMDAYKLYQADQNLTSESLQ